MLFITISVFTVFMIIAMTGNGLINWAYLGFEVYLPLFMAIMVCKYVGMCCGPSYENKEYHNKTVLVLLIRKFLSVYLSISGIGFLFCILLRSIKQSFDLGQVCFIFMATSFFLSSLGLMITVVWKQFISAIVVIVAIWTWNLITKALLIFPVTHYFYLFIFYTGKSPIMVCYWNKTILCGAGILCWLIMGVYTNKFCKSS